MNEGGRDPAIGSPAQKREVKNMSGFFTYEHIKELVVYCAFAMIVYMCLLGYAYWIVTFVKWVVRKLKSRFGKKNTAKEENANE